MAFGKNKAADSLAKAKAKDDPDVIKAGPIHEFLAEEFKEPASRSKIKVYEMPDDQYLVLQWDERHEVATPKIVELTDDMPREDAVKAVKTDGSAVELRAVL